MKIASILLVEDSDIWRDIYKTDFEERFDAIVVDKSNLEMALEAAKERNFDLYLTDGDYPLKRDGLVEKGAWVNFYNELRKIDPKSKILLISANEEHEARAKEFGIEFILKSNYNIDAVARLYEK